MKVGAATWSVLPWLLATGCTSTDLGGVAALPPLDYAVYVTGAGVPAAEAPAAPRDRTFAGDSSTLDAADVHDVLQQLRVFRHSASDPEVQAHMAMLQHLRTTGELLPETSAWLQRLRDDGYDWLLVVEELRDGPVEGQGVNDRWPLTLATWLMLGLGMVIPDHTFESSATLQITLRDLQTGRIVHEPLPASGPVDLSLVERSDFLGVIVSIIVPPFWVYDDDESVVIGVRSVTRQRLLQSLARDLKSAPVRERLAARSAAGIAIVWRDGEPWLDIDAADSLAQVRLRQVGRPPLQADWAALEERLRASLRVDGRRWRYSAPLRLPLAPAPVQVLVATIDGSVASQTLLVERPQ